MVSLNIWLQSNNTITKKDEGIAIEDSFVLVFNRRADCFTVRIPVDSVKICLGLAVFSFVVDCELSAGLWDVSLFNETTEEYIFECYPAKVFDTPSTCVKTQL